MTYLGRDKDVKYQNAIEKKRQEKQQRSRETVGKAPIGVCSPH